MLSAWSDPRVRMLRERLPHGTLVSAGLMLLLVLCVSNSTVSAGWVPHSEVLTNLALLAAVAMGVLALTRARWALTLGLALGLAPLAGSLPSFPALHAAHPSDPGVPLGLVGAWRGRVAIG